MLTRVEPEFNATAARPAAPSALSEDGDRYFFGLAPLLKPFRLKPPAPSTDMEGDYASSAD